MNTFSRFAVAAVLVAGFGGVAHAQSQYTQSQFRQSPTTPDSYYALSEGRSVVDGSVAAPGAVPPSESQTVMGLRVPR